LICIGGHLHGHARRLFVPKGNVQRQEKDQHVHDQEHRHKRRRVVTAKNGQPGSACSHVAEDVCSAEVNVATARHCTPARPRERECPQHRHGSAECVADGSPGCVPAGSGRWCMIGGTACSVITAGSGGMSVSLAVPAPVVPAEFVLAKAPWVRGECCLHHANVRAFGPCAGQNVVCVRHIDDHSAINPRQRSRRLRLASWLSTCRAIAHARTGVPKSEVAKTRRDSQHAYGSGGSEKLPRRAPSGERDGGAGWPARRVQVDLLPCGPGGQHLPRTCPPANGDVRQAYLVRLCPMRCPTLAAGCSPAKVADVAGR